LSVATAPSGSSFRGFVGPFFASSMVAP
jgi:hypothetical protein